MLKKLLITTAICAAMGPAVAETYFIMAPLLPAGQAEAQNLDVQLKAITPPTAFIGQSYTLDLKPHVRATGTLHFEPNKVTWGVVAGELPDGIQLTNGVLTGVPSTKQNSTVTISASFKHKTATQELMIPVTYDFVHIEIANGHRQWSDGSTASSCKEYLLPSDTSKRYIGDIGDGSYLITAGGETFPVWCDMTTDGGGWTVFQRRFDGSVNFYRGIAEYRAGFGNVNGGEYWLGLAKLHAIASSPKEMRVDLGNYQNQKAYVKYTNMVIGGAPNYVFQSLTYAGGTAGDSMGSASTHSVIGRGFSAFDYDLDDSPDNCSVIYSGAWWYKACHTANLNGLWLNGPHTTFADGINWETWKTYYESLTFTEMKIR